MANQAKPMDIDDISEFDNKENSLQHNNVLSQQTDKGYEELDVSELNMKLRWSTSTRYSPNSSLMSLSCTATSFDNKSQNSDGMNNTLINESSNLSQSFDSTISKSETLVKIPKLLPLKALSSDQFMDANRNAVLRPFDGTVTLDNNDITVTVTGTSDNDDNYSLASSSTSPDSTPEATTPIKDIPKPTGSPIMRGIKSVLNMFRPSQSPIPPEESGDKTSVSEIKDITSLNNEALDSRPPSVIASTPIATHRKEKECILSKKNSPSNRGSLVFNEDLETELEWREDSTVIFSNKERAPIHKLFFQHPRASTSPENSSVTEGTVNFCPEISNVEQIVNTTPEPMDVSYNDVILEDEPANDITSAINQTEFDKDESEFLDCESTINESQLLNSTVNNSLNTFKTVTYEESKAIEALEPLDKSRDIYHAGAGNNQGPQKQGTSEYKKTNLTMKTTDASGEITYLGDNIKQSIKAEGPIEKSEAEVSMNIAPLNSSQLIDNVPSLLENTQDTKLNLNSEIKSEVAANILGNEFGTVAVNINNTVNQSISLLGVMTEVSQLLLDRTLEKNPIAICPLNQTIDIINCAEIPLPEDEFTDIETDALDVLMVDSTSESKIKDVLAKQSSDDSNQIESVPVKYSEPVNSYANLAFPIETSTFEITVKDPCVSEASGESDFHKKILQVSPHESNDKELQFIQKPLIVSGEKQPMQDYINDNKAECIPQPITPDIKLNQQEQETVISLDCNATVPELQEITESDTTYQVNKLEKISPKKNSELVEPKEIQEVSKSLEINLSTQTGICTQPSLSNIINPDILNYAPENKEVVKITPETPTDSKLQQKPVHLDLDCMNNSTLNKIENNSVTTNSNMKYTLEETAMKKMETVGEKLNDKDLKVDSTSENEKNNLLAKQSLNDSNQIESVPIKYRESAISYANLSLPFEVSKFEIIEKQCCVSLAESNEKELQIISSSCIKSEEKQPFQDYTKDTIDNKAEYIPQPITPDIKLNQKETVTSQEYNVAFTELQKIIGNLEFPAESKTPDPDYKFQENSIENFTDLIESKPIQGVSKSLEINLTTQTDIAAQTTLNSIMNADISNHASENTTKEFDNDKEIVKITPETSEDSELQLKPVELDLDYMANTNLNKIENNSVTTNSNIIPTSQEIAISLNADVAVTKVEITTENPQPTAGSEAVGQTSQTEENSSQNIMESVETEPPKECNTSFDVNLKLCNPAIVNFAPENTTKEFDDEKEIFKINPETSTDSELHKKTVYLDLECTNIANLNEIENNSVTTNSNIGLTLEETPISQDADVAMTKLVITTEKPQPTAGSETVGHISELEENSSKNIIESDETNPLKECIKSFDVNLTLHTHVDLTSDLKTTDMICGPKVKEPDTHKEIVSTNPETSKASDTQYPADSIQDYSKLDLIPQDEKSAVFLDAYLASSELQTATENIEVTFESSTTNDSCQLKNTNDINSMDLVNVDEIQDVGLTTHVDDIIQSNNNPVEEPIDISMVELNNRDFENIQVAFAPNIINDVIADTHISEIARAQDLMLANVQASNIEAVDRSAVPLPFIENIQDEPMDITFSNVKEQDMKTIQKEDKQISTFSNVKEQDTKAIQKEEKQISKILDSTIVMDQAESKTFESLKLNTIDIQIQKTDEVKDIDALEEELIISENNSPYVSFSAPEELPQPVNAKTTEYFDKNDMTVSASPPISSKGYNINFDDIENPFISKTMMRASPDLDLTFEPIDKVPTNAASHEQSPLKPEAYKTIPLDNHTDSTNNSPKQTSLNVIESPIKDNQANNNLNKLADGEQLTDNNSLPTEDLTEHAADTPETDSIMSKTDEKINDNIPETKQTMMVEPESKTNITSQATEGNNDVMDEFALEERKIELELSSSLYADLKNASSSEQSAYFSAGTSSAEGLEPKPALLGSDFDVSNVNLSGTKTKIILTPPRDLENPFATKSNIPQSPSLDSEMENPFTTKSKMRQSPPPPNSGIQRPDDAIVQTNSSANTTFVFAKPKTLEGKITECQLSEENFKSKTKSHEINISQTISNLNVSAEVSNEKDATDTEVHTEDEDTLEGPCIETDLEHRDENFESEKVEIHQVKDVLAQGTVENFESAEELFTDLLPQETDENFEAAEELFTDLPPQETDENFDAAGEMFIDADAFEFLMNQNMSGEVSDSGKESLFLKFDPLFAKRVNSEGIVEALSKVQKRQSISRKMRPPPTNNLMSVEKSLILGPSDVTNEENTKAESNSEDLNATIAQKPTMVVPPAVNPVVTPRKKAITPVRSCNRLSMNLTSPAMAVIDRLLSLSSNNSPASPERAPPVNTEQTEADRALIQLRELLAEKELNVHHLRCESKELKDRFVVLDSQMKTLEAEGEKRLKNIKELNEKLAEKNQENKHMSSVVEEFERTIAGLIANIEEDKKKHAEERLQLVADRDEQTAHLASMEVAFSDLHSKYEKSKQLILSYKAREDIYKKSNQDFQDNLVKMQNNYELLKQHATSKLNHANQELDKMNRSHESEVLKLNAMIKRKDLYISSLEETLAQKTKANDELTAICDELINRVG